MKPWEINQAASVLHASGDDPLLAEDGIEEKK